MVIARGFAGDLCAESSEIPELRSVGRYRYWSGNPAGIYFYDPGTEPVPASMNLFHFEAKRVTLLLSPVSPPMNGFRDWL